ncbi:MAG: putative lipoprotein [uncultured Rubrobacteraceae bacterium]|uniref:Putative lipoprotein n=1 Tax=uncultured Rubrobacteraceae bacterium TaxID=349277 RepID=A0A6J4QHY2_9ACTN|nr:MAG: putative lipoprotein [uncultured Rubrobacteraceae bacterium]
MHSVNTRLKGTSARHLPAPILFITLLIFAGCGGGSESSSSGEESAEAGSTAEETTETTAEITGEGTDETSGETASSTRPYTAIVGSGESGSGPSDEALVDGAEDFSDGPLKENRLVAYYGNPREGAMGVLGETDPETMMANLKEQTAAYSAADPGRPAVPTIELIASTAQRDPGEDGTYINRLPAEEIEEYATLAEENGALLLLDVQLGQSTVADEIETLSSFLEHSYVHLAIDTEYYVREGEIPGVDLGGVDGAEIQGAVEALSQLVEEAGIPDKQLIEPTENVQVVLNADGFGLAEEKTTKYDLLVGEEPIQYGGFKLFYRQDEPLLSPDQVLELDPAPVVINYQ